MADTSWMDALPDVQPTAGMIMGDQAKAAPAAPKATRAQPDTSWMDALPEAAPTSGMLMSGFKAAGASPEAPAGKPTMAGDVPMYDAPQTPRAAAQPQPAQTPTWSNIGGAIPSGLYEGIARIPNLPTHAVNAVSDVMRGLTGHDYGHLTPPINENPTGYQPVGGLATSVHDASSATSNTLAMGAAARMVTPLLPTGSAPAIVSRAVEQTPPSTVVAAGAGGAAEEPIARNVPEPFRPAARVLGNVGIGGVTAGAEAALGRGVRGSVSPEAASLAQLGRDTYDIPIRGGQISGSRLVRTADSALKSVPFSGHGALDEEAQSAFNTAVSRTIGEDAAKITPEVMNAARTRIGGVLQDVENRNVVNFDDPLMHDLSSIESSARSSLTDPEFAVVKRQLGGLMANLQPGDQISGGTYGNLMHKGAPLDAAANSSNPNISGYAGQIREALRGSLQRSLTGDDLAAYQTARSQWKNMRTIEPLTLRADVVGGASPATGDIIPAQLRGAVNRSFGNAAFAEHGQLPLNDLASIGQRFLKELPSSQTSERSNFMRWLERAGAVGGALFGGEHFLGVTPGEIMVPAAAAAGTTGLISRGLSVALRSDKYAESLIERGLQGGAQQQSSPVMAAGQASVPLLTSAGVRQLEPPAAPGPSINPATGLPQFNMKDNQAQADTHKRGVADYIVKGIQEGDLGTREGLSDWIRQNKRDLRTSFGGQGIQNIEMVASLLRRNAWDKGAPATLFSVISAGQPSTSLQNVMEKAGVSDAAGLASLAMVQPDLAKILATRTQRSDLTRVGEARVIAALQRLQPGADTPRREHDNGHPLSAGDGLESHSNLGQVQGVRGSPVQAQPDPIALRRNRASPPQNIIERPASAGAAA